MNKSNDLLKGILNTIENGLRKDINPDTLAGYYNYSTRQLERIFKYAFNVNIGSYIRARKLAASLNELIKTNEKVLSIALEYSFDFEQSYIRSFKREFGITPGEFRKSGRVVKITPPLRVSDANKLTDKILSEQEIDLMPQLYIVGGNSYGNVALPDSPYGYEVWGKKNHDNKLLWYGAEAKGGAAFRAEWNNSEFVIERIGYYMNEGKPYTSYNNIFCDFKIDHSVYDSRGTELAFAGVCGWFKNPLIHWSIIENWFGDAINDTASFKSWFELNAVKIGEFKIDGSAYSLYKSIRINSGSIEGTADYNSYSIIRENCRQKGTISISEHFKAWEKLGLTLGNNIYETKFFVSAMNGTGWFDAKHVSLYTKAAV